ncbi:MAG: AAA family ATPase [Methanobacteriaceae archaeon]|nr:AAA family ATPase [Methanobacteriaceae archaeon]
MKIWIFTTKEPLEYLKLDEGEELKRAATDRVKKDDIILIYRGKPYSNIKYIFKAKNDAYKDIYFREDWDTAIDLHEKIEIPHPIEYSEMKGDHILGEWNTVRKRFMGSFFKVPSREWERLKELIINKNPELEYDIGPITLKHDSDINEDVNETKNWTFAINKDFYYELKNSDEIVWNSAKEVKKDDIIFIYTGAPYSNIGFILKAMTDPFEDPEIREKWNRPAVLVQKEIEITNPITLEELTLNPILSNWAPVRKKHFKFQGSHFKMSDEEHEELKRLILEKNSELAYKFEELESEYIDIGWGRAHVIRDICYLISENPNLIEKELFKILKDKVGNNNDYWRAYYQRAKKENIPKINLESAQNLRLIEPNSLRLTSLGQELTQNVEIQELFTHHYSLNIKKFFFKLAVENLTIKTAMQILRERKRLRFYAPTCDLTNKVIWNYVENGEEFLCQEKKHKECRNCDRLLMNHIKETSLPFETDKKVKETGGYVFWMCSRITPMHLTGKDPGYSGNYIYWDKEAEVELGDLIKLLDEKPRIWKITPGEPEVTEKFWPIYTKEGYIGIGWNKFNVDYRKFKSQRELRTALEEVYEESKPQSAKMIWDFTNEIKIGDYVIANKGLNDVIGIGIIESDYIGPNDPENLNLPEYPHVRNVDWKIIDDIKVKTRFDRKTVTELDGKRWNEIISSYSRLNPDFKLDLLKEIYKEFTNNYLDIPTGQGHIKAYNDESDKAKKTYEDILDKVNNNIDATDEILYELVPHKGRSIVGVIANIKAFFEKTYEIKPEKFPDIAINYFDTINTLIENVDDPEIQENKIQEFANSEFSKGFGAGILSPILFYIDSYYPLINKKTVDTVLFLSKIIGEPIRIDMDLKNYIKNKETLNQFLENLSEYLPEILDPITFTIFCHWLCDEKLGYYAKGNPLPLIESYISDKPVVFIKPDYIETKLKIAPKIKEQVCGTINSNKNIMFTGAPGTGKTNLAEDICKVAEVRNFTNGYVLTTATSDWTTFDTIGGYMPDEKSNKLIFEEGKFLQAIKEDKWLIIDEINRADIDKAFGQLFTVLSGQGVELPFKIDGKSVKIQPTEELSSYFDSETATYNVGKNWRILATMNIYDKDFLFEMSYAFMRRFTFIYIELPVDEVFIDLINQWGDGLNDETLDKVAQLLRINPHREIGPAIFKDVVEYIAEREKIGSNYHVLEDAVMSFIMPQFEGLEKPQILEIWKIFNETFDDTDELQRRLEEISTIKLDEIK